MTRTTPFHPNRLRTHRGLAHVSMPCRLVLIFFLLLYGTLGNGCSARLATDAATGEPASLVIDKDRPFSSDLARVANATSGILTVSFYAHPMNDDTGEVVTTAGTGFAITAADNIFLVTAAHVLDGEERISHAFIGFTEEFTKSRSRTFLYPPDADLFGPLKRIAEFLQHRGGGTQVSRDTYQVIFSSLEAAFENSVEITTWTRMAVEHPDLAVLQVPKEIRAVPLPTAMVEMNPWIVTGKEVVVYGNPNAYGRHYREGVISRPDSLDHRHGTLIPESYHIDVIVAEGDSGAPVLSTASDGRLKVYGVVAAAMPRQPRLGRVVSGKALQSIVDPE